MATETKPRTTIQLATIERLREINQNVRLLERANKGKSVTMTLTGTFPTAKQWNAKDVRKVLLEDGLTVKDATVTDVGARWITLSIDGTTHWVKATDDPSKDAAIKFVVA